MSTIEAQKTVLEKRVMEKAKAAYDEALKKAAESAAALLERTRDEEESKTALALDQARAKADSYAKENRANTELEAKLFHLKSRDTIVNGVFEKVRGEIESLRSDANYSGLLAGLVEEGAANIGAGKITITAGEAEKKLLADNFIKGLQDRLKGAGGKEVRFSVAAETLQSPGGVVMSNEDETIVYDNSWPARFDRLKTEMYLKVSEIVFK